MTQRIELQAIPSQSLTVTLDDDRYHLTLKETNGVMAADIIRNEIEILRGSRIVAGTPLLPYLYQETGNVILLTENGELPHYREFNNTQFLIYASPDDLRSARGG